MISLRDIDRIAAGYRAAVETAKVTDIYDNAQGQFSGALATITEAAELLLEDAYQGTNQAGADPTEDTIWSPAELAQFVAALTALTTLINLITGEVPR